MKMLFSFTMIGFIFFGCVQKKQINSSSISQFELWVNDTIISINNPNITFKKGIDFLELTEKTIIKSNDTQDIIYSLLKDYNQIPNDKIFSIEYERIDLYSTPQVPQLTYEVMTDFKNIRLVKNNSIIEYDYIRGRINSFKSIIRSKKLEVIRYYEFNLDGIMFLTSTDSIIKKTTANNVYK